MPFDGSLKSATIHFGGSGATLKIASSAPPPCAQLLRRIPDGGLSHGERAEDGILFDHALQP
jgi:hypothetical protein